LKSHLASVDERTRLAGSNRFEMLLFSLGARQRFGINVFKIQEVVQCPELSIMPQAPVGVSGIANFRGQTIPFIDLAVILGLAAQREREPKLAIISEYNRTMQAFLVDSVDRIVNLNWEAVHLPPPGTGNCNMVTSVVSIEGDLVEIIDVEKVLADLNPDAQDVSAETVKIVEKVKRPPGEILIVDDSAVARGQIRRTLEQMKYPHRFANNGREALNILEALSRDTVPITDKVYMVVSDIEMPEMDGYTLTAMIRANPALKSLHVLLHSSMSGIFNRTMVEKVGANDFLAKFSAEELAGKILGFLDPKTTAKTT